MVEATEIDKAPPIDSYTRDEATRMLALAESWAGDVRGQKMERIIRAARTGDMASDPEAAVWLEELKRHGGSVHLYAHHTFPRPALMRRCIDTVEARDAHAKTFAESPDWDPCMPTFQHVDGRCHLRWFSASALYSVRITAETGLLGVDRTLPAEPTDEQWAEMERLVDAAWAKIARRKLKSMIRTVEAKNRVLQIRVNGGAVR